MNLMLNCMIHHTSRCTLSVQRNLAEPQEILYRKLFSPSMALNAKRETQHWNNCAYANRDYAQLTASTHENKKILVTRQMVKGSREIVSRQKANHAAKR